MEIQPDKNPLQIQTDWDPLDSNVDQEMISATAKRTIKNILKSYVGTFDPFAELIQNAMDAVDKREEIEPTGSSYKKTIWLEIDLPNNSFTIIDNGVGFKEQEFKSFLAPSQSFKDSQKSRGNKGVGATYIAYGFNHLELGTKSQSFKFSGEIKDGRDWVEDYEGKVARPRIRIKQIVNESFSKIDQGSYFSLKFGGTLTRPKDLSWYQATTADQWLFLLLTKTPLGIINLNHEFFKEIDFFLKVTDNSNQTTTTFRSASYLYPHLVISASKDLAEIRLEQDKLRAKGADLSKLPKKFFGLNGVYEYYDSSQLKELPSNKIDSAQTSLIDKYSINAYGYFCYSTNVWDVLNDDVAKLRAGMRFLRGGIQLANNTMIQGDIIVIPLTQNVGYQNQTHVIIHFTNADPDLGRKGFQPELKELAEILAVGIVNKLKIWRHLLRQDKGNKPDIVQEVNLHEWVKQEEIFETTHPLFIKNKNFFNPVNEISILSQPQSEQDVIVLFSQLLAGGVIRGIKLLSTSQNKQYDGLYKFFTPPPIELYIYNANTNPLGILNEKVNEELKSKPRVLEYKYCLDALISELENGEKHERDISLVIVWEAGIEWKKNYDAISLLDSDNLHHRNFHGITHSFHTSSGGYFDAIVLSDLIRYLNDPQSEDINQKKTYSDSRF
jgi:Histidine kinase-, DNA gyrase B-, and HSP90-like ATPase